MSNERDQGYSALQRGDYETAIKQLEAACRLDPNDFHAHLYLGGAYHQMQRPADAVRALMQAVALQPANAQARYNLAIAQEQTGNMEEAIALLRNALALKPDYTQAQQALQRLSTPAPTQYAPAQQPPTYGTPTQQMPGAPQSSGYGAQPLNAGQPASAGPPPLYGAQPLNAPTSGAQPLYGAQPLNAPTGAQPLNAADNQQTQYGVPPLYGGAPAPPAGGYGQQTQSGAPPAYGTPGYVPPTGYGQPQPGHAPAAYGQYPSTGYAPNYGYQDNFSVTDAFRNLVRILVSPRVFFDEQAGCEGIRAPFAMILVYVILAGIGAAVQKLSGVGGMATFIILPFLFLIYPMSAAVVHVVSLLFGNKAPFSISLRAVTYANAPSAVVGVILSLLSPLMLAPKSSTPTPLPGYRIIAAQYNPNSSNQGMQPYGKSSGQSGSPGFGSTRGGSTFPMEASRQPYSPLMTGLQLLMLLIGSVWSLALFAMALSSLHRLSTGGVVGVIVVCIGLAVVLAVILFLIVGVAIMGMMGAPH